MRKISEKYPHNGIYKFENFVENVLHERASIRLESPICNLENWYLDIKTVTRDNGMVIFYPSIKYNIRRTNPLKHFIVDFFCKIINNKDDSDSVERFYERQHVKREFCMPSVTRMTIPELMDENNGWLDNGALSVEIGIYVESIKWRNGIRSFNFYDRTFNCDDKCNMITMDQQTHEKRLFSHKQLLTFHSPCFSSFDIETIDSNISNKNYTKWISEEINMELLEKCLQIAHGVHLEISLISNFSNLIFDKDIASMIIIAQTYKLTNVVRYCERTIIENEQILHFNPPRFQIALKFKLHRYLIHILKSVSKLDDLKQMFNDVDIQKMSSESMKFVVQKILRDFC